MKSLVCHPARMTHASIPADARAALGLSDTLIRLSPGCEHPSRSRRRSARRADGSRAGSTADVVAVVERAVAPTHPRARCGAVSGAALQCRSHMRLASLPIPGLLALTGAAYLTAILVLVVTKAPLGSPLFFAAVAVRNRRMPLMLAPGVDEPRRPRAAALLRVRPRGGSCASRSRSRRSGPDSDMVRYLWDGRVQRLGYNPYTVCLPIRRWRTPIRRKRARMPSRRTRTPYPPAAQLFFRSW